jgi:hypothetical protein
MSHSFGKKFHFLFNLTMIVLYALAGLFLIFILQPETSSINYKLVGGVLTLYAVYRTYRLYTEYKRNHSQTDEQ